MTTAEVPKRPRFVRVLGACLFLVLLAAPVVADAAPRSGGSFGGRSGFRVPSSPRSYSSPSRSYGGGGSHFIFLPSFGGGWGGYGYGGGGGLGTLLMLGLVGVGVVVAIRAIRRARGARAWDGTADDADYSTDRAYVYELRLGLGRSGRDIQERLAGFAAEGDTSSAEGLAELLRQTSLELMRSRDSIRYGAVTASGPMSLTNGETKMNAAAMAERSRFQVERVRGADGSVRRSTTTLDESPEVLEYVVVTVVVASRRPLDLKTLDDAGQLQGVLQNLGSVPGDSLLGLEVIWTPADPQDSLTDTDLQTTYPDLRSL